MQKTGYLTLGQFAEKAGVQKQSMRTALQKGWIKYTVKDGLRYFNWETEAPRYAENSPFFEFRDGELVRVKGIHPWLRKRKKNEVPEADLNEPPKQGTLLQRRKMTNGHEYRNPVNDDGLKDAKKAREQQEIYKARKMKLDYEKDAEEVVNKQMVDDQWSNTAQLIQQKILAVPDRVAPILTGIIMRYIDQRKKEFEPEHFIRTALKEELIHALTGIAKGLMDDNYEETMSPLEVEQLKVDADDDYSGEDERDT